MGIKLMPLLPFFASHPRWSGFRQSSPSPAPPSLLWGDGYWAGLSLSPTLPGVSCVTCMWLKCCLVLLTSNIYVDCRLPCLITSDFFFFLFITPDYRLTCGPNGSTCISHVHVNSVHCLLPEYLTQSRSSRRGTLGGIRLRRAPHVGVKSPGLLQGPRLLFRVRCRPTSRREAWPGHLRALRPVQPRSAALQAARPPPPCRCRPAPRLPETGGRIRARGRAALGSSP